MKNENIYLTEFNQQKLKEYLNTIQLGRNFVYIESVDSTNTQAKLLAQQGATNGTVVLAEHQTNGKGRLGRQWCSPKGAGLWFSILLRPQISPMQISGITLVTGLAVCKAIRKYTKLNALIKWPNDVIIGNKKLCGILTEMSAKTDKIDYVVVGVGINVNTLEFDEEIAQKATSLKKETGKTINREEFLTVVLGEIEECISLYLSNPNNGISKEYIQLCATLGRQVTVSRGNNNIQGKAVTVTSNGDLVVETNEGKPILVNSGEVIVQGIY